MSSSNFVFTSTFGCASFFVSDFTLEIFETGFSSTTLSELCFILDVTYFKNSNAFCFERLSGKPTPNLIFACRAFFTIALSNFSLNAEF